jgi:hypothetical protein
LKQKTGLLIFGLAVLAFFFSCAPAYTKHVLDYNYLHGDKIPDYSKLEYWAAHPYKKDPSDSVPAPLKSITVRDSVVDVFFVHPTTYGSKADTAWNADINDALTNARTDYTTILYQASVFNECRVFAPRYRQAHIRSYFSQDTSGNRKAFDIAYEDIKTAFQYYLDHYNNGRPIVIASHSQGTTHAKRLLKDFFENKPLKNRLVAAYLIGMSISKNYFTDLSPCRDSAQTGCFVGWRTYRKGYEPEFVRKENGDGLVTNPLTWTSTDEYAPKSLNKGGVLRKFNIVERHVADAQIHNDVLWIHKPHFRGSLLYRSKNYHIGDINLFYMNIRENLRTRIGAFWKH